MSFSLNIRTAEERQAEALARARAQIAAAIDARVEGQARELGYNSAAHLASYTSSGVPEWAAEARAFVSWRDAVWLAAFAAEGDAQAKGTLPGLETVMAALPRWPGAGVGS